MTERKKEKKNPIFKRLVLGLAQHIAVALIFALAAGILFNSFIPVDTMDGVRSYRLDPFSQKTSFEESEVFQDLFRISVQDIIHLAVLREQMETAGAFDPEKVVDVTEFLSSYGENDREYGEVSARYSLEDLIKWGRYGVEYRNRVMSLSDFVNYYGQACAPENFGLDDGGNLYFRGFLGGISEEEALKEGMPDPVLEEKMKEYTDTQLEDMAFSYIMRNVGDGVSLNREDDGSLTVYIETLICRYQTIDGKDNLYECVDNWADFLQLQKNVADAAEILHENYELYLSCIDTYREGSSNLKYVVRMRTARGGSRTYSNVSALETLDEERLTETFADYRGYLIYYPDSLEFMGNTELTDGELYRYIRQSCYPYPDDVYLWIAVDSSYEVTGDAFHYANSVFEEVVPYAALVLSVMIILCFLWLGLGIYLTVTAGVLVREDGGEEYYLNPFDRIWTEIQAVLAAVCGYGMYRGYLILRMITEQFYGDLPEQAAGWGSDEVYLQFGAFAVYGFLASLFLNLFWYSLARRFKVGNLYRDSFLHACITGTSKFLELVFRHRNSVISVLLPYNFFLLVNLFAVIGILNVERDAVRYMLLAGILFLDALTGMVLFKKNAEHNDIVEGISRIRSGESSYKLDVSDFRGMNRELADAVNNIGEGIDNAVKTSMKDERLKTDLITNVSHDIKTPLTSIINYVDLLKQLDIRTEPAKDYIGILENKAQRLKELTDDLVEASKITSGNIELNMEALDMGQLLLQTVGEFSEKLEEKNLQAVTELEDTPAIVYGDSRRMWRVMENLFNNICKYAMEGTRVYAQISVEDGEVDLYLKNVSQALMNIHADELTERFIRGDSSRSTEGSGLGLFIAKSLTEVQGGTFEIQLDADLFKVKLAFPLYERPEKTGEKPDVSRLPAESL